MPEQALTSLTSILLQWRKWGVKEAGTDRSSARANLVCLSWLVWAFSLVKSSILVGGLGGTGVISSLLKSHFLDVSHWYTPKNFNSRLSPRRPNGHGMVPSRGPSRDAARRCWVLRCLYSSGHLPNRQYPSCHWTNLLLASEFVGYLLVNVS